MARLEDSMREALRTWCRLAEPREIIELVEIIREELATRDVMLAYAMEYRAPGVKKA